MRLHPICLLAASLPKIARRLNARSAKSCVSDEGRFRCSGTAPFGTLGLDQLTASCLRPALWVSVVVSLRLASLATSPPVPTRNSHTPRFKQRRSAHVDRDHIHDSRPGREHGDVAHHRQVAHLWVQYSPTPFPSHLCRCASLRCCGARAFRSDLSLCGSTGVPGPSLFQARPNWQHPLCAPEQ